MARSRYVVRVIRRETFATAACAERVASWLDALATVCGRLDAAALSGDALDVRMTFGAVERLRLGPARVDKPPRAS